MKYLITGGITFLIALFIGSFFFAFTFSKSIPPGIYIRSFSQLTKNKYVKFNLNPKYQKPWLKNRFLLKKISAVKGDYVQISQKGYYVNNQYLGEVFKFDSSGNKLPIYYFDGIVPAGYIFVLGDNSIYSYDSRYFGPVNLKKTTLLDPFILF